MDRLHSPFRRLFSPFVALLVAGTLAAGQLAFAADVAKEPAQLRDPLDIHIAAFTVTNEPMEGFTLRLGRVTGVVSGLIVENVPRADDGSPRVPVSLITIDRANVTPRELLDEAVRQAPEYLWRPVRGNMVNIIPVKEAEDPKSFVNYRVDLFAVENKRVRGVMNHLFLYSKSTRDHPLDYYFPHGEVNRAARTHEERLANVRAEWPVTFSLENCTLLDATNALYQTISPDAIWVINANVLRDSRVLHEDVVTQERAEARAYAAQPDATREEAARRFDAARAAAPYEPLRMALDLELAGVLADPRFVAEPPQWEQAYGLYEQVFETPSADFPQYPKAIDGLVRAAKAINRQGDARTLLDAALAKAERPRGMRESYLLAGGIALELEPDRRASIAILERRRAEAAPDSTEAAVLDAALAWFTLGGQPAQTNGG